MYEVDPNTSLGNIPDNILDLLTELKEFKEDFNIEVEYCRNKYNVSLCESTINRELNTTRYISIKITDNPCSYLIQMITNQVQHSNSGELKKIYEIEVEGENDFKLVKQDVEDLIKGKKGSTLSSNYPL